MHPKETNPIRRIIIVGGGSAGWMTAAYLSKAFIHRQGSPIQISLVESKSIPNIGVGEATIPMFQDFFRFLDIPEDEWMDRCKATFKLAIRFERWLTGQADDYYWHTFGSVPNSVGNSLSPILHWLYQKSQGEQIPFAIASHESATLSEENKAPKIPFDNSGPQVPYAYHLSADLLADMLKEYALAKGVKHYVATVEDAILDEHGFVSSIKTDVHGTLSADLYIDCSGFHSVLIEKTLKESWDSYKAHLLCDRAVVIRSNYAADDPYNEQGSGLNSFTTATALLSGWAWHTPLISSEGNGYVYSSAFSEQDEAETIFRQFLGEKAQDQQAVHLKMRVGKMQKCWAKNCVAIGLAGGFIEPLESTGLALVQAGLSTLLKNFPDSSFPDVLRDNYNRIMQEQYENIRDFIILHYCLTERVDHPFWKAVKYETLIPDSLKEKLENWQHMWPHEGKYSGRMFGPFNYASILAGMQYLPKHIPASLPYMSNSATAKHVERVQARSAQLSQRLPTQAAYFKQLKRIQQFKSDSDW